MPLFLKLTETKNEKVNINFDKVICFKELILEPEIAKENNIMKFTKIQFAMDEFINVFESEEEINFMLENGINDLDKRL